MDSSVTQILYNVKTLNNMCTLYLFKKCIEERSKASSTAPQHLIKELCEHAIGHLQALQSHGKPILNILHQLGFIIRILRLHWPACSTDM